MCVVGACVDMRIETSCGFGELVCLPGGGINQYVPVINTVFQLSVYSD